MIVEAIIIIAIIVFFRLLNTKLEGELRNRNIRDPGPTKEVKETSVLQGTLLQMIAAAGSLNEEVVNQNLSRKRTDNHNSDFKLKELVGGNNFKDQLWKPISLDPMILPKVKSNCSPKLIATK
eukprot:TRINITY_DN6900_c0_g1_i1.p1 TRINITY_DN6900_c0_g1~~TRINITY_DN6900_c0_g1_i1.p1  ORF type:complete len:123 (-),score=20.32 TRINITY_DN6900_c0_g1_i1:57-425(-)